jgi:hypothetical protein
MSWKIKRVIRTNAEFGYPKKIGYEVQIESTGGIAWTRFMTTEEAILRLFLEKEYPQDIVDKLWKLIEDYGQMKYSEGSYDATSD